MQTIMKSNHNGTVNDVSYYGLCLAVVCNGIRREDDGLGLYYTQLGAASITLLARHLITRYLITGALKQTDNNAIAYHP